MGISWQTILVGYTQSRTPFLARISEEKMNNPFSFERGEILIQGDKSLMYLGSLDLETARAKFAYRNEPPTIEYKGEKYPVNHRILEEGMAYYLTAAGQPGRLEINGATPKEISDELYTFSGEKPVTIDLLFYGPEEWERTVSERNIDNYAIEETPRSDRVHEMQGHVSV